MANKIKKVLITHMSSKGQVLIPSEFRRSLGLKPGTSLAVYTNGSALLLKPLENPRANAFENLLKESTREAKKS
jgi:AbrB family looped-hinge helix DNA binding protein